jgi:hypothetical protein
MPFITDEDYAQVRGLLTRSPLREMEEDIYALNRRIRALPDDAPEHEWRAMKKRHDQMLAAYRSAGGTNL